MMENIYTRGDISGISDIKSSSGSLSFRFDYSMTGSIGTLTKHDIYEAGILHSMLYIDGGDAYRNEAELRQNNFLRTGGGDSALFADGLPPSFISYFEDLFGNDIFGTAYDIPDTEKVIAGMLGNRLTFDGWYTISVFPGSFADPGSIGITNGVLEYLTLDSEALTVAEYPHSIAKFISERDINVELFNAAQLNATLESFATTERLDTEEGLRFLDKYMAIESLLLREDFENAQVVLQSIENQLIVN